MLEDKDLKKFRELVSEELDSKLKPVKSDIAKIRRDTTEIVDFFDREYLGLRSRVERIEEHLNLKPLANSL